LSSKEVCVDHTNFTCFLFKKETSFIVQLVNTNSSSKARKMSKTSRGQLLEYRTLPVKADNVIVDGTSYVKTTEGRT
jgi:hypothetical protein